MTCTIIGDEVMDGLLPFDLLATAAAAGDMRLDERGIGRIELAVQEAAWIHCQILWAEAGPR